MSHDIDLVADLGGPEPVGIEHPLLNIHGRGLGVIARALGEQLGPAIDTRPSATDLGVLLRVGLHRIDEGWVRPQPGEVGEHWDHAVWLMTTLAQWCERAPQARVRCSR